MIVIEKNSFPAACLLAVLLALIPGICSASGGLNCSITDSCSGTPVVHMKNSTGGYWNSHAQNASLGTYPYSICCAADNGTLGYDCNQAIVLRLSNETNAHAQAGNYSGPGNIYPVQACLSSDIGEVQCFWDDSCSSDYECLGSMAGTNPSLGNLTNAMLGPCEQYQKKVCCRIINMLNLQFVPPTLSNQSTTSNNWISVNVSSNKNMSSCILDWYNGTWTNLSMDVQERYCYRSMESLSQGYYYFRVYGNSTEGIENVTEDRQIRYYVAPSAPPGDAGGSPGGGGAGPAQNRSFSVEPDFIKLLIKQGETKNSSFMIANTGNVELLISAEMVSAGKYFILNLPQNFTLAPNETRAADLYMLSLESMELGVHTATVYIKSGNITKQVSVVMEVSKRQGLFDVTLEIEREFLFVDPGTELPLQVRIANLGDKKKVDVTAIYVIKDMQDHQIVNQRDTFAVENHTSIIKNILIPESTNPGKYSALVIVEYEGQAAVASYEFEVVGIGRSIVIGTNIVIAGVIGASVAASIVLVYALRRRSRSKQTATEGQHKKPNAAKAPTDKKIRGHKK